MKQPVLRKFSRDAPKTFPGHDVPRPSGGPLLVANLRRPWSRPTSPSIPSPSKFGCRRTVPSVLGSSETLLSHSSCLPAYSKGREHNVFSSRVYSKDTEVLLTMTFDTTFIKAVVIAHLPRLFLFVRRNLNRFQVKLRENFKRGCAGRAIVGPRITKSSPPHANLYPELLMMPFGLDLRLGTDRFFPHVWNIDGSLTE